MHKKCIAEGLQPNNLTVVPGLLLLSEVPVMSPDSINLSLLKVISTQPKLAQRMPAHFGVVQMQAAAQSALEAAHSLEEQLAQSKELLTQLQQQHDSLAADLDQANSKPAASLPADLQRIQQLSDQVSLRVLPLSSPSTQGNMYRTPSNKRALSMTRDLTCTGDIDRRKRLLRTCVTCV